MERLGAAKGSRRPRRAGQSRSRGCRLNEATSPSLPARLFLDFLKTGLLFGL